MQEVTELMGAIPVGVFGSAIITGELMIFLVCGIVLGLCAVSHKVMLIAAAVIFVKGIIWDAYFVGMIHPLSVVVCTLSVVFFLAGWVVVRRRF